jgi:hypothetical protein
MASESATFDIACAICGATAMRVSITVAGDPLDMPGDRPPGDPGFRADGDGVLTAIDGTTAWIAASALRDGIDAARAAIVAGDARALLQLDPELVPLFCPDCGVAYCRAHWVLWDLFDADDPSWYDETRGHCPKDHERRVFD